MVGRNTILLALLLSTALAGCLSEAGEEGTESLDADATDSGSGPGADSGSGSDPGAPSPDGSTADANGTVEESYSWEGTLGTTFAACGPTFCYGASDGTTDASREILGITAASVTVDWDAATTPRIAFGLATRCDGPCDFVSYASGSPPLAIDAEDLDPDHTYRLIAWHPYQCEPATCSAGAQGGVGTTFTVEGTLTKAA